MTSVIPSSAIVLLLCGGAVCGQTPTDVGGPPEAVGSSRNWISWGGSTIEPARFRIPASYILQLFDDDYSHESAVDRVILGTHSRGTARCTGDLSCSMVESRNGAQLELRLSGRIISNTRGLNGPAVIDSTSTTTYTATKPIVFDGQCFLTGPLSLNARTWLQINDVNSTAPGLRGLIVRKVGRSRAEASHADAELLTAQITEQELRDKINAEVDARIAELNAYLDPHMQLLRYVFQDRCDLQIVSDHNGIEIIVAVDSVHSQGADAIVESSGVDTWLQIMNGMFEPAKVPAANALTSLAPHWAGYFQASAVDFGRRGVSLTNRSD